MLRFINEEPIMTDFTYGVEYSTGNNNPDPTTAIKTSNRYLVTSLENWKKKGWEFVAIVSQPIHGTNVGHGVLLKKPV